MYSDAYLSYEMDFPKANLLNEEWRESIRELDACKWNQIMVAGTTWLLSQAGDENSKEVWDPIGKFLISLRHDGFSTGIIHHLERMKTSAGTSAREDHADIVIGLKRPKDYQAEHGARFISGSFSKSLESHGTSFAHERHRISDAQNRWRYLRMELEKRFHPIIGSNFSRVLMKG